MSIKGLQLEISSLPSKYGIGELQEEAFSFLNLLKQYNFNAWDLGEINPHYIDDDKYNVFSSFAIEEIYISLDYLYQNKYISKPLVFETNKKRINLNEIRKIKRTYYLEAYLNYLVNEKKHVEILNEFAKKNEEIANYAHFMSLKEINEFSPSTKFRKFENDEKYIYYYYFHLFLQMLAYDEWNRLKEQARENDINIILTLDFDKHDESSDTYFVHDENEKEFIIKKILHYQKMVDYLRIKNLDDLELLNELNDLNFIVDKEIDTLKHKANILLANPLSLDKEGKIGSKIIDFNIDNLFSIKKTDNLKRIKKYLKSKGYKSFTLADSINKYHFNKTNCIISINNLIKQKELNSLSKLVNFKKLEKALRKINKNV